MVRAKAIYYQIATAAQHLKGANYSGVDMNADAEAGSADTLSRMSTKREDCLTL